jgi:hypothetical protein
MRIGISIALQPSDRRLLDAIIDDRNAPQKHVWRAKIVLLSADGVGTAEIMRRTAKSKTCVWRWQERFMKAGLAGLLRDKRLAAFTRRSNAEVPNCDHSAASVQHLPFLFFPN